MKNLISDCNERMRINHEKMAKVIIFLKQEIYSDISNLTLLLGYKSRRPLDRLLNKLIALGYVQKHVYEFHTGKVAVWGITDLGLTQNILSVEEDFRPFEPSKVKFTTLEHKLMNQRIYIYLQSNNWSDWLNADQCSFRNNYDIEHRPDAIMTAPNGHKIAIETERTLKQVARYRSIFKSHIIAKQKGYWSAVFYVVPNDNIKKLIERRFDKIEYIQFDESKHPFEHYRNKLVRVFTLDEIQVLNTN